MRPRAAASPRSSQNGSVDTFALARGGGFARNVGGSRFAPSPGARPPHLAGARVAPRPMVRSRRRRDGPPRRGCRPRTPPRLAPASVGCATPSQASSSWGGERAGGWAGWGRVGGLQAGRFCSLPSPTGPLPRRGRRSRRMCSPPRRRQRPRGPSTGAVGKWGYRHLRPPAWMVPATPPPTTVVRSHRAGLSARA